MKRFTVKPLGKRKTHDASSHSMVTLLENDPYSDKFVLPTLKTPKDLVRYLLAEQQRVFGETILSKIPYPALLRNFKLLMKQYSTEEIGRAIALSVRVGNNPGSTKFVKECVAWLKDSSCPPLKPSEKTIMPNKS